MVSICDDKVVLRDFLASDVEKRILWETTETEWQLWDAPWEYEGLTEAQKQKDLASYIHTMQGWAKRDAVLPDATMRTTFQICTKDGVYIGWCNSYRIDDDYTYSKDGTRCAIGIDLPDTSQRKNGYAFHALCLFIDYLTAHGEAPIYTQTWSGNVRMIALAKKLGFTLCCTKTGIRTVRGATYDGLTFVLDNAKYLAAKQAR